LKLRRYCEATDNLYAVVIGPSTPGVASGTLEQVGPWKSSGTPTIRTKCRRSACAAPLPPSSGGHRRSLPPHLIASGLTGEPTAPVIGIAGATNMNSYTPSALQSAASSATWKISPMVTPMIGMVIQCQG
jgi:hypothetical protein